MIIVLISAIRLFSSHLADTKNPSSAIARKMIKLSPMAAINPYATTPIASQELERADIQSKSRNASTNVQMWSGKAVIRNKVHKPCFE
jgi:hypothetical protein